MTDVKSAGVPTLVERWLEDQREWQKTAMSYLDSLVKNDEFLVHLGNAMRGSLLAGRPYPTAAAPPPAAGVAAPSAAPDAPPDDRLDRVLFALHEMQGQLNDLRLTIEELRNGKTAVAAKTTGRKAAARKSPARRKPGRARG